MKPGLTEVHTLFFLYEITQQASFQVRRLRLVLINSLQSIERGAMEKRATVLPNKSTSYCVKGALRVYACSCARISGRILLLSFALVVSLTRSDLNLI